MENLVDAGALAGVIDYTLSELANSLLDGLHATGPDRLRVAGRAVASRRWSSPAASTSSTRARRTPSRSTTAGGKSYYHNPVATLVRLEPDEMAELGRLVAERLNEARGPVRVLAPTPGLLACRRRGRRPLVSRRPMPPSWTRSARRFGPTSSSSSSTRTSTTRRSPTSSPSATSPSSSTPRPRPEGRSMPADIRRARDPRAHPARRGRVRRRARARLRRLADHGSPRPRAPRATTA